MVVGVVVVGVVVVIVVACSDKISLDAEQPVARIAITKRARTRLAAFAMMKSSGVAVHNLSRLREVI